MSPRIGSGATLERSASTMAAGRRASKNMCRTSRFADAAARLASAAAREAERLAALFVSPGATAQVLVAEARTGAGRSSGHPGWMAYHAGVAAGLAGRMIEAGEMFNHVLEGPAEAGSVLRRAAERMSGLAVNSADFGREILSVIALQRDRLGLQPLDGAKLFSDERVSGGLV